MRGDEGIVEATNRQYLEPPKFIWCGVLKNLAAELQIDSLRMAIFAKRGGQLLERRFLRVLWMIFLPSFRNSLLSDSTTLLFG